MNNTFTTGLMSSGKSKSLIENYKKENDRKTYALSISIDQKTGLIGSIQSRSGISIKSVIMNRNRYNKNLSLMLSLIQRGFDTIYVDEIQFIEPSFLKCLLNLSDIYKVTFNFYGLLTTFTGEYFESSKLLLDTLDIENIIILEMKCQKTNCNNIALNNARIVDGKIAHEGNTLLEEKSEYMSLCDYHYFLDKM